MIVCPKCGNQANDDAIFCDQCGTRLVLEAAAAPVLAPAPAGITCPKCGASSVPGEAFCENCGAPLAAPEPEAAPAPAAAEAIAPEGRVCPACGAKASPDDAFCYICGADLATAAPAPAAAPVIEAPVPTPETPVAAAIPMPAPNTCPSCGAEYTPGAAFCDYCGAALAAPAEAAAPVTPAPPMASVALPRLIVAASGMEIPLPNKAEILVGREDPVSGVFPDIDLTPHKGEEGGVSRRHCKIVAQGMQYTVEDLNSTNGTMVNRQRLNPGVPYALSDGDEIRAGRVRLVFKVS